MNHYYKFSNKKERFAEIIINFLSKNEVELSKKIIYNSYSKNGNLACAGASILKTTILKGN